MRSFVLQVVFCLSFVRSDVLGDCERELIDMQVEIRKLQDKMKEFTDGFKEDLKRMNETVNKVSTPLVAFSAYTPTDTTPENGRIVVFSRVSLDLGGGYDPLFGIFTVPVKGLYHFTAHFCNKADSAAVFAIFLDARELAVSTVASQHPTCSSVSEITVANRGQKVTVQGRWDGSVLFENEYRKPHFIGLLIHAM